MGRQVAVALVLLGALLVVDGAALASGIASGYVLAADGLLVMLYAAFAVDVDKT